MSDPVVAIDDLGVRYAGADADALSGVSLVIAAGEVVGLVGHAGSGRSTLLRCLDGIVPGLARATVTGRIRVAGRDPTTTRPAAMADRVAIVLDDAESRMSQFSVEEEVAFGLECLGTPLGEMRRRVPAALAAVGLADVGGRPPLSLSGGEQQRLAVACAIAVAPALLLLDDPTAHLDPVNARTVVGLAVAHARRAGAGVILVSEDVDLLAEAVDRVVALDGGRLAADGSPGAVFAEGARTGRWPAPAITAAWARVDPGAPSLPVTVEQALAASTMSPSALAEPAPVARRDVTRADPLGEPALELRSVSYRYPGAGRDAVEEVSITVAPGEVVALAGESGSGKSTLARLAAGLLRPSAGTILAGGVDLASIRPREVAGRVGLVFQNPNHQLLTASVARELAIGPRNLGVTAQAVERRVEEVAGQLGLAALLDEHPYRLDMAARKRVTIGAVVAMDTPVLVLDEPTSGQDATTRSMIAARLRAIAASGTAVLVISHDLSFAEQVADRTVVLRRGRVVASGDTRALLRDPDRLARAGLEPPPLHRLRAAMAGVAGRPHPGGRQT